MSLMLTIASLNHGFFLLFRNCTKSRRKKAPSILQVKLLARWERRFRMKRASTTGAGRMIFPYFVRHSLMAHSEISFILTLIEKMVSLSI